MTRLERITRIASTGNTADVTVNRDDLKTLIRLTRLFVSAWESASSVERLLAGLTSVVTEEQHEKGSVG